MNLTRHTVDTAAFIKINTWGGRFPNNYVLPPNGRSRHPGREGRGGRARRGWAGGQVRENEREGGRRTAWGGGENIAREREGDEKDDEWSGCSEVEGKLECRKREKKEGRGGG